MSTPILDVGVVAVVRSPGEYEKIRREVMETSLSNYADKRFSNFNINRFDVSIDVLTGEPIVQQITTRLRPEQQCVPPFEMRVLTSPEVRKLPQTMAEIRLNETAAPFVDEVIEFERPEGTVHSTQDMYIFDEKIETLLDGEGVSLDLVAYDINNQVSVPKHDLTYAVSSEIDGLKRQKGELGTSRGDYLRLASSILRSLGINMFSGDESLSEKTPLEVYVFCEQSVKARVHASHELIQDLDQLHREYGMLTDSRTGITKVSHDTMMDTLSTDGFWFPEVIGTYERAVDEFGVGDQKWLGI